MSIYVSRSADGFVRSSGLRVARCHETSSMLEQAVLRAVFPRASSRDGYQKASGQINGAYGANHVMGTKKRPDKKMMHMVQIT